MNWFLIIILSVVSVILGIAYSLKYKKRMLFFSGLILLCQNLDLEINYSRERLKILIENLDDKIKKDLLCVDKKFLKILDQGIECSAENLFEKNSIIKTSEREVIAMFFKNLGRSNVENQSIEIKNYLKRFNNFFDNAVQDDKKFGKLGLKMGIVVALAIAIILI